MAALLLLAGCLPTPSELTLTVLVDRSALSQVANFPTLVSIDYDNVDGETLTIDLCEWGGQDFLTVELPSEVYKGCRSATTVRGVLAETDLQCRAGDLDVRTQPLPPEEEWIGYGERVVFDSPTCGVIQEATLTIEAF